jgi:hypothetical protein
VVAASSAAVWLPVVLSRSTVIFWHVTVATVVDCQPVNDRTDAACHPTPRNHSSWAGE